MNEKGIAYGIEYRGRVLTIGAHALIGRSPACKVALDHPDVSRRHARLTFTDEGLVLEDLGSANGVFVNGDRIAGRQLLKRGDVITIGGEALRFLGEQSRPQRASSRPAAPALFEDSGAFDDLWEDDEGASFDRGEATELRGPAAMLAESAVQLLERGAVDKAEKTLLTALEHVRQRAAGGSKIGRAELGSITTACLQLAAEPSVEEDWLERLGSLYEATRRPPPSEVLEQLSVALVRASPAAEAVWRRYIASTRKS